MDEKCRRLAQKIAYLAFSCDGEFGAALDIGRRMPLADMAAPDTSRPFLALPDDDSSQT
jgi:hypothetical protein